MEVLYLPNTYFETHKTNKIPALLKEISGESGGLREKTRISSGKAFEYFWSNGSFVVVRSECSNGGRVSSNRFERMAGNSNRF